MHTTGSWRRLVQGCLLPLYGCCFLSRSAEAFLLFKRGSRSLVLPFHPITSSSSSSSSSTIPLMTQLFASSSEKSSSTEDEEDLLVKAARLRQEAKDMETVLRATTNTATSTPRKGAQKRSNVDDPQPVYTHIEDSVWTFTYRFAVTPERNNDDDDDNNHHDTASRRSPKYGGRFSLHLLANGYTDLLTHEPTVPSQALDIVKAWGWDLEQSQEQDDDKAEYVLFSMDFLVPDTTADENASSTTTKKKKKERFYFQARQEKDNRGIITLRDGTVTVKQDVTENRDGTSAFWGLFSPKGILARFTYVGNFAARPSRKV